MTQHHVSKNEFKRTSTRLGIVFAALALAACGSDLGEELGARKASVKGDNADKTPALVSTTPGDDAKKVPIETKLAAFFNVAMDPLSESAFTLQQGDTKVEGKVATTLDGKAATFTPSSSLATDTVVTATIAKGVKSTAGLALAKAHVWTFVTANAASIDVTAPVVSSTTPAAGAVGVVMNTKITATFSKPLDPLTVTKDTFTVSQNGVKVDGVVAYGPGTIATFTPSKDLEANAAIAANFSVEVMDLIGHPLALPFVWSFTTGNTVARGPSPVLLGTAGYYAILSKTGVSTVPASAITGDIGVSPAAASYLTGFGLTADATNVFSRSPQVTGKLYAANYAVPTPSNMTTAISNMETAYTDGQGRIDPDFLELGSGNLGGKTLAPGLYKWTSTVTIPANVTISGGANDVWIFQTSGDLIQSANMKVILSGGAQAKNVFWVVAGYVTLGAGAHFEGIMLAKTQVTLVTGSTMNGRILSQTHVALQKATVVVPAQ